MAYASLTELKALMGISSSDEDTLLSTILTRAEAIFDRYFSARWEAETETRYFDPYDIEGSHLWLDKPLLTVTTLTNGDGTTLGSSTYRLQPRNGDRYWYIQLLSSYSWQFSTDGEISVAGTWGYAATAPDEVTQATLRLATWLYREKDANVFNQISAPEAGIIEIPAAIPADVRATIDVLRSQVALA